MIMIRNTGKTLLLGAAVAAAAVMGTFATAEAKHGHHGHHGWYRPYFYVAPVYTTSYAGSCSYFYSRWRETGSRYWRHRYYQCIY
jgi:hypothetical protein